jgi:alpha-beta hydrolase superfamily lysophospholipase
LGSGNSEKVCIMSDAGSVAGLVAGATAIQVVSQVQAGRDPVPNIITAGVFLGALIALGALLGGRYEIPKLIAGVTLLAVILGKGYPLLVNVNKLILGAQTSAK